MKKEKISLKKKIVLSSLSLMVMITLIGANILNVFALSSGQIVEQWLSYSTNYTNADGSTHFGQMQKILVNGKHAFCIQPSVPVGDGSGYIDSTYPPTMIESKVMYHAFYNTDMSDYNYAVAFNMVQEQRGATVTSTTIPNYEQRKAEVMALVNSHDLRPNFNTTNIEVNLGESVVLTDSNNVISQMNLFSNDVNVDYRVEGNKLIITPKINSNENGTLIFDKYKKYVEMNYLYSHSNKQDLLVGGSIDPVNLRLSIKVNKYVDVTLNKEDLETGKIAQGDSTLVGAKYTLFKADGTEVETKTIDETLKIKFEKLLCSNLYYIQETEKPNGYLLNSEKIEINPLELIKNGTVGSDLQYSTTSKEQVIKGNVAIYKTITEGDSGVLEPTPNAEFTIKLKSDVEKTDWDSAISYGVETTDDTGFVYFQGLPYGKYIVRETKSPSEVLPSKDFEVEVKEDGKTIFRAINNAPFKSWLKIVKVDEDGKNVILSNATFTLKDKDGNLVKQKVGDKYISKFTTDETGEVTLPLMLKSGEYTIDEISVPNGFVKAKSIKVTVSRDGDYIFNEDNEPVNEIKVVNEKPTAKIIINKTYERDEDNGLGGTTFQLKANSKILNATDGTVLYEKGDVINVDIAENGLYTINESGRLEIADLPMSDGKVSFALSEYSTLDGYVLDEKVYIFDFEQDDETTKEYVEEKDILNVETKVEIFKKDSRTKENLKGVELELLNADGEIIEKWTSTNGSKKFDGLLVGVEYTVREVKPLQNYLNTTDVRFVVKNTKEVQEVIVYNTAKEPSVETGDSTNSTGWLALLGLSCIVIGTVIGIKNSKRKV